jgi:hypothetical protein
MPSVTEVFYCLFTPFNQTFKELLRISAGSPVFSGSVLPLCFCFQDSGSSGGRPGGPYKTASASIKKGSLPPHRLNNLLPAFLMLLHEFKQP